MNGERRNEIIMEHRNEMNEEMKWFDWLIQSPAYVRKDG